MAYEGLEQSPNIVYTGGCSQPAGDPGGELVLRDTQGAEVFPGGFGLRLAALRQ